MAPRHWKQCYLLEKVIPQKVRVNFSSDGRFAPCSHLIPGSLNIGLIPRGNPPAPRLRKRQSGKWMSGYDVERADDDLPSCGRENLERSRLGARVARPHCKPTNINSDRAARAFDLNFEVVFDRQPVLPLRVDYVRQCCPTSTRCWPGCR